MKEDKRVIKFRAWHNGEMLYQHPAMSYHVFNITPDGKVFYRDEPGYVNGKNHDSVLMQFTGFLDVDGDEIYESDVCRVKYAGGNGDIYINKIVWDECGWSIANSPLWTWEYFEIIGNIYEHPELLTPPTSKQGEGS
jgi:hypothetical protein